MGFTKAVFAATLSGVSSFLALILFGLLQVSSTTGTVIGIVKMAPGQKPAQARVVLLPPKYAEIWNKQVQQRIDNYWETFKPEFYANKEHFAEFTRLARTEGLNSVASQMRRELASEAGRLIKQTSANGQFEFKELAFGSYLIVVDGSPSGQDFIWSRPVDIRSDIPIFIDAGKPVS